MPDKQHREVRRCRFPLLATHQLKRLIYDAPIMQKQISIKTSAHSASGRTSLRVPAGRSLLGRRYARPRAKLSQCARAVFATCSQICALGLSHEAGQVGAHGERTSCRGGRAGAAELSAGRWCTQRQARRTLSVDASTSTLRSMQWRQRKVVIAVAWWART